MSDSSAEKICNAEIALIKETPETATAKEVVRLCESLESERFRTVQLERDLSRANELTASTMAKLVKSTHEATEWQKSFDALMRRQSHEPTDGLEKNSIARIVEVCDHFERWIVGRPTIQGNHSIILADAAVLLNKYRVVLQRRVSTETGGSQ